MPTVAIKKRCVVVGDKKVPLISGEMHYWRLRPSAWSDCLDAMRAMGITIVATYIPWYYHEYKRGSFDFTGKTDPSRDVVGFLRLARKKKMWVIVRPGPYIYSECPHDGVPAYAYKYHRLHPTFLSYAAQYITHVCRILKPFQASRRGGHIILLQADNEIDPWPDLFGHQYGMESTSGLFQNFIEKRYQHDITQLNKAWGTHFTCFSAAGPIVRVSERGDESLRRHADYYAFKHWYAQQVAAWVIAAYKKEGISIPLYLNLYPFFYAHDWLTMEKECDMTGIDLYPENEFGNSPEEHRKFLDKIRYTRTYSSIPYIAEFASGVWHNHHYTTGVLTPQHYQLLVLSALQAGVAGWNWYMLVNRDNWYMAPISEQGEKRHELYTVFKDMVTLAEVIQPAACEKMTDVAVTFHPLHYATKTVPRENSVLKALYDADVDYEFFDARTGKIAKKILFYTGDSWMSEEEHKTLYAYVAQGGTLVCFAAVPHTKETGEEYTIYGFEDIACTLFEFKRACSVSLPQGDSFRTISTISCFHKASGKKITAQVEGSGVYTVGYEKKVGKGRIIHLGVEPSAHAVKAIIRSYGGVFPTESQTPCVKTAVLTRGNVQYLIAVNTGENDTHACIALAPELYRYKKMSMRTIYPHDSIEASLSSSGVMSVAVRRKSGTVVELKRAAAAPKRRAYV